MEPTLDILDSVASFLRKENVEKFQKIPSPSDQVKFIYEHEGYFSLLQIIRRKNRQMNLGQKDKIFSQALRDEGNKCFSRGDDSEALDFYNQAVMAAPCNAKNGTGEDLAITLGNRAAVMLRQEKYTYCLDDIELAKISGYPTQLLYKLLRREAQCLSEMFRFSEAEKIYEEARNSLKHSSLNEKQRELTDKELKKAIAAIRNKKGLEKAVNHMIKEGSLAAQEEVKLPTIQSESSSIPNLASSIRINQDILQGRHAIATQDINAGDVIGVEEPLVHFLNAERLLSNCTNCFKPVVLPVPCTGCSSVVFCSKSCRETAMEKYHKWECSCEEALTSTYSSLFRVYRLICQKPVKYFKENQNLFQKPNCRWGVIQTNLNGSSASSEYTSDSDAETASESSDEGETFEFSNDDLENAFHLETHNDKLDDGDRMALAASSALLLYYLKKSGYFGPFSSNGKELSEDETMIGQLIYHFLQVGQFNMQQISQMQNYDKINGATAEVIGSGLNVSMSLLNHSCNPNTLRCNIGTKTLLVASRHIPKGAEVTTFYAKKFQDDTKHERQKFLSSYHFFTCQCEACLGNWPTYEDLKTTKAKRGIEMRKIEEIKTLFAVLNHETIQNMQAGYFDKVVTSWANFCRLLDKVLVPPHRCYLKVTTQIFDSIWLKFGNKIPGLQIPVYKKFEAK